MEKPRSRVVGLYMEGEKFRDHIKFALKARGIRAEDIQDIQRTQFNVILTNRKDIPPGLEAKIAPVEEGFSEEELVWTIRVLEKLPSIGEEVIVGVDPGKRMGAVALCRNILIDAQATDDTSELVDWISGIRRIAEPKTLKVRVGRGERWSKILDALEKGGWAEMEVEAVDESHTTKSLNHWNRRYGKDVSAAIRIALRL